MTWVNTTREQAIWKQYPEFPFIEANQFGEVRTVDRYVIRSDGQKQFVKGRVLKQHANWQGYMRVQVGVNGKPINLSVHRIIATCFIPNPNNYPEVNHIDNNPKNNAASNLEWCTPEYNIAYREKFGTSAKESTKALRKPVIAVNQETSEVFWFESQREAERKLGVSNSHINDVLKGRINTTHDYWFCYVDDNTIEKARYKFGDKVAKKVEKLMRGMNHNQSVRYSTKQQKM